MLLDGSVSLLRPYDHIMRFQGPMKKTSILSALALSLLLCGSAGAQVKRVRMHIAGYLCGN